MARKYPHGVEAHHVAFPRAFHTMTPELKSVRQNRWLQPPLDMATHDELHRNVGIVPVVDRHTAVKIARTYEPTPGDYLASVEGLMTAYEVAAQHPRIGEVEQSLAHLVVRALDQQRPYIQEGLWIGDI